MAYTYRLYEMRPHVTNGGAQFLVECKWSPDEVTFRPCAFHLR